MTNKTPRPRKERFGIAAFRATIVDQRRLSFHAAAARFDEALRQRRRLMKALRKIDPDHPVLAELDQLDGRKPQTPASEETS